MTKKSIIIIAFCFSTLWASNPKYLGIWEKSQGPFGGYISDILVNGDTLYCATRAGLFQKQVSNSWEFLGLGDLAIREIFQSGQYIYAVGYYGCYRYNINTKEFKKLYSKSAQTIAAMDSIVFMGTGYYPGLYKSVNYGDTWEECITGIDNYDIEKIFITKSKTILASAAGTAGSGVFRSTDIGNTWTRIDPYKYAWNFQGIYQKDNKLYGYDYSNYAKVYISVDDGLTWKSNNPPADHIYAIFVNNSGLYVGTSRTGVFKSTNDGLSWSSINNGISNLDVFSMAGNENNIYAGSFGGIYRLKNTSSWENITSGLSNSRVNAIIKVSNRLFSATHGVGIQVSDDNGLSWHRIETDLSENYITDMINIGNDIYIIASANWLYPFGGSIYKSVDNGNTWIKISNGFDTGMLEKIAGNDNFLLVGTSYGLFKSTDGGNSWIKVLNGIANNMNVSDVAVLDSTAVVLNGTNNIFRTTDFGNSWESLQISGLFSGRTVQVIANDYYISSGSFSRIYKSTDYGKSWELLSGVPSINSVVQDFAGDEDNIFIALSKGGVLSSNNDGVSWQTLNFNLDVSDVLSLYYKDDLLLAGTDGGGIYKFNFNKDRLEFVYPKSEVINQNWINFEWTQSSIADRYRFQLSDSPGFINTIIDTLVNNTYFEVRNLEYDSEYYYRVGTVNEFWDDDFSASKIIRIDFPTSIQLDQNYPNPFNSKTSIRYHVPEKSLVKLIIFDITGRKISTLINSVKDAGSHTFIYETSTLASGVYFYQIRNRDKTITKKFILIK